MNKYGVQIYNYAAGSVYSCSLGVRNKYDRTRAMLTNSLFLDFLYENGLKVSEGKRKHGNNFTRDIICITFGYGSRSYEEEIKRLNNTLESAKTEDKKAYIENLITATEKNKDKFDKKTADQIRTIFYNDGVDIWYGKRKVHYRMLYRTPGKAKKGNCTFICDRLYKKARDFLYMGIKLPKQNAPIVEIGAYSSLVTSTIVDRVQIRPEQILVLKDVDSSFYTTAISIETDDKKHCHAIKKENYKVTNTMFDGQALIDLSIFPKYGNGYVLLRHHFMKAAAFATDIQLFMRDWCAENSCDYDTYEVPDMWGNMVRVRDIKLITTNNAMKWMKFGLPYEYWSDWVRKNDCMFGIVKTAHHSKLGDVQRMSYQMINTLSSDIINDVMRPSLEYMEKLKTDIPTFMDYLKRNSNFSNDFEVLRALAEHNEKFIYTDYFRQRHWTITNQYLFNLKNGRAIQDADNLVLVGCPYAMLLCAVGEDAENDQTMGIEDGTIQCFTERFEDGEYLAGFRSPHNGQNNILYLHNVHHPYMFKYFRLGRLCMAVNVIHTDIQDRANGCDFDSDQAYVTNQPQIVEHARECYRDYPTIVNNIPKESNRYENTADDFARVDNGLAASQRAIGESSNLAQIALTYADTYKEERYKDYVCILSVLAQCAIDNAKRTFDIDINKEIKRIKKELDVVGIGYPAFWTVIRKGFNADKINSSLSCPMNHIYNIKLRHFSSSRNSTIPLATLFQKKPLDMPRRISRKVEDWIEKYSLRIMNYNTRDDADNEQYFVLREDFEDMVEDIRQCTLPEKYAGLMCWLLDRAFRFTSSMNQPALSSTLNKNKSLLIKTLYDVNNETFLNCFEKFVSN